MSQASVEPDAGGQAQAQTATAAPATTEVSAQEPDWKAEARKWESRAKENKTAAEELAQIKEANKTAEQRAADRLAAAEAKAVDLEAKALRAEVAAAKGVPAALLAGTTLADLEASADALITFRGGPNSGAGVVRGLGNVPEGTQNSNEDWLRAAARKR